MEHYYIKKANGRYEKVDRFEGFPSDGVWYVADGKHSSSMIMRIGDCPEPMKVVELYQYSDIVMKIFANSSNKSHHDIWKEICIAIANKETQYV
jgi:hypothetical protein